LVQQKQIPVELQHKTGYASLSEKGLILEANLPCATLLGTERGLCLESHFPVLLPKVFRTISTSFRGFF
jgi:hypothetical protein